MAELVIDGLVKAVATEAEALLRTAARAAALVEGIVPFDIFLKVVVV